MKFCFVLLLMFVIGCATEPKIADETLASVSGKAVLYSEKGVILPLSSGITVTAEGTGRTTQTNDSGAWTITGLAAGKYTFSFTKTGFGSMKLFDFTTEGKDTISGEEIDMCKTITDAINFQSFGISLSQADSTPFYNVIGTMQPPFLELRSVVLCLSTDSMGLANDPASAPVLLSFVKSGSGYDGNFDWGSMNAFSLKEKNFVRGTTVYATLCISAVGPEAEYLSTYFDPTTDRQVFTAIKRHSQIHSAVMP